MRNLDWEDIFNSLGVLAAIAGIGILPSIAAFIFKATVMM